MTYKESGMKALLHERLTDNIDRFRMNLIDKFGFQFKYIDKAYVGTLTCSVKRAGAFLRTFKNHRGITLLPYGKYLSKEALNDIQSNFCLLGKEVSISVNVLETTNCTVVVFNILIEE